MSERIRNLVTYQAQDNLVVFKKKIAIPEHNIEIEYSTGQDSIHLESFEKDGELLLTRDSTSYVDIYLYPEWSIENPYERVKSLIGKSESPEDTTIFKILAGCQKTRWAKELTLNLSDITNKCEVKISVPINDIYEKVEIGGFITRTDSLSPKENFKADRIFAIISRSDDFDIYFDEASKIASDSLPIVKADIKNLLFSFYGLNEDSEIPCLQVNENNWNMLMNNKYESADWTLMMVLPSLIDFLLKWVIFIANMDDSDLKYKAIVDYLSKICAINKIELYELREAEEKKKIEEYLRLSSLAFNNIQLHNRVSYKKTFENVIAKERKYNG